MIYAAEINSIKQMKDDKGNSIGAEAYGTIDCEINTLWDILTDHNRSAEFMPNMKKNEILKRHGNALTTKTTVSIGVKDIEYTCSVIEDKSSYTMTWKQLNGPFIKNEGMWVLKNGENGKVIVYYKAIMMHSLMPEWVKDKLLKNSIPNLFTALQKRADSMK